MRQLEYWNEHAGQAWADNADSLESVNRAGSDEAFGRAGPRAGEVVLDVGCGTGATTFELGRAVGPTGSVTGIDLSAPMIRAAERHHDAAGMPWVGFTHDAIETTPLASASTDLVFSRMCLMLLDDVESGVANLHQALRPGGRLVATWFRGADENLWLPLVVLGAAPYVGELPPLPLPGEPGPFRFADPNYARTVFTNAGFAEVELTAADDWIAPPGESEDVAALLVQLGPAGGPYRRSSPADQAAARSSVLALLDRFTGQDGRLVLPSATWILSARRS